MRDWGFVKKLRRFNPLILSCVVSLSIVGTLFIYSACSIRENPVLQVLHLRHIEVALAGLAALTFISFLDYRKLLEWHWISYAAGIVMLMLVPLIGESRMGGQRWLFGIQPAELMKLAVILTLAQLFGQRGANHGFKAFLFSGLLVVVPATLILLQPDLGTAMVMASTFIAMLFAANIAPKAVWSCVLAAMLLAGAVLGTVYYAEKAKDLTPEQREQVLKATHLRPHQIRRLQVFLFPDKDLHGSGYNRRQSEIAVGSGGWRGKGYGKGEQYTLGYLPPSVSSNDFIFSVLAEETGFMGTITVLLLFLALLWSGLWVAFKCQDDRGRLICVGVTALVFSHAFINIAMTIGMMPITGLPLPFISYGRTFMVTLMLAFGFVQSVSIHGREPETRF
ncbi:MAG: rod shape-determining protein RodA [Kiritimatiellae bacterium]|nr:rod shape-determining protein RodA [Kiritimatiellia bacterium]